MKKTSLSLIFILFSTIIARAQWSTSGTITSTNNSVGIGTATNLGGRLMVMGTINSVVSGAGGDNNNYLFSNPNAANTTNDPRGGIWLDNDGRVKLRSVTGYGFAFRSTGDTFDILNINDNGMSIGTQTMPSGYKLAVNGSAIVTSLIIKLNSNWPDYVFKPTYQLPSLAEVKSYIDQNQHLPEIPSADEIAKDGLNVGEMNKLLMKKVEELTLYLIEKDDKEQEQKKINQNYANQIEKLNKQLESLSTQLNNFKSKTLNK
ncbi:hypothetical protein FHW88_000448 [Mucilaginibacter sp. SG538B]|uniref:hypothetical protein n=1 Tax=Mucilaginibacter sp. SG538B TaxID=2587021 RepID=UPI00159E97E4|nr:hypothetical protein [Mucilaginibacter sp. SG538B]NVM62172.1 hypothetical protein [Mucilaginibacter sp. SG538B]